MPARVVALGLKQHATKAYCSVLRIAREGRAVDNFLVWHQQQNPGPFSKAVLQSYRAGLEQQGLAPATINVHLSALRRLAAEAADNGLLDPDIAAGIAKVKGTSGQGVAHRELAH